MSGVTFEQLEVAEQVAEIERMLIETGEMIYCNELRYALARTLGEDVFYGIEEDYKSKGLAPADLGTKENRDMCTAMCVKIAAERGVMLPAIEDIGKTSYDKETLN